MWGRYTPAEINLVLQKYNLVSFSEKIYVPISEQKIAQKRG
jgi:hypothetical protein